jgi:hypothetical protein
MRPLKLFWLAIRLGWAKQALLCLCCTGLLTTPVWAASPVFELGISTTQYLPPPMYGTWQVQGQLVSTTNPQAFPPTVNDIWTLQQDGPSVTLSNPNTGAAATIHVDSIIEGHTVVFHHTVNDGPRRVFTETPTLRIQSGDWLMGETTNLMTVKQRNGNVLRYQAVYALKAHRIGGARVQFMAPSGPPPTFQIDPVQHLPLR